MQFTKELLEKAKSAKTAEELSEMAKAENIGLTAEEAANVFAELNESGELSDEELDNVAGGWCAKPVYTSGVLSPDEVTFIFSVGEQVTVKLWGDEKRTGVIAECYAHEDYSVSPSRYYPFYRVTFSKGALLEVNVGEGKLERVVTEQQ